MTEDATEDGSSEVVPNLEYVTFTSVEWRLSEEIVVKLTFSAYILMKSL